MSNSIEEARTECQKCEELLKERQQLRAELAKAQIERDAYKSLYDLTDQGVVYTKEELFAQIGKGPSLEQLIAELEQEPI